MKLRQTNLTSSFWNEHNIEKPSFDFIKMKQNTINNPTWVHFGAGNIFRGYIAKLQQHLLNQNESSTGINVIEVFDTEIIEKIYEPYDSISLYVGLNKDGTTKKELISSIAEAIAYDNSSKNRCIQIFINPSLQIVSFTITEKGYALKNLNNEYFPIVENDLKNGPNNPNHIMSIITSLLYQRFLTSKSPITLLSLDNCSHNGEKLKNSVIEIANIWNKNGFVDDSFLNYLSNETKVSFPWSMIDKITPRPSNLIEDMLKEEGIEDINSIITSKGTYIAPFVNAEIPQYLVIEDTFTNGRPHLEKAGVYFTDRKTVNDTERMKVTTCLNPLHTALAIYGCLLNYKSIAEEMADFDLSKLVNYIGQEGMKVVTSPKIIDPYLFLKEVIEERLPNPYIPDTPQRIATDTSQKVGIRFGETIKAYTNNNNLNPKDLIAIPLAIAGWFRYLLAVDDDGIPMTCSLDPMLSILQEEMKEIKLDQTQKAPKILKKLCANKTLFGVDLNQNGCADVIINIFLDLASGTNTVHKTIQKYLR